MATFGTASGIPGALLAHQGGWDEVLLVVGPLLGIGALLWLAKRRADRLQPPRAPSIPSTPKQPTAPDP